MQEVNEISVGRICRIDKIVINNFSTVNAAELSIDFYIHTEKHGNKKLHFSKVKELDMGYSGSSDYYLMSIIEVTDSRIPDAKYRVELLEDMITFYCEDVEIDSFI